MLNVKCACVAYNKASDTSLWQLIAYLFEYGVVLRSITHTYMSGFFSLSFCLRKYEIAFIIQPKKLTNHNGPIQTNHKRANTN